MLNALRSGAKSFLMKVLLFGMLVMAMLGLAVMDVQGMFRGGVTSSTVAEVGGQKIGAEEFRRGADMRLREQQLPRAIAIQIGLPRQILLGDINRRLYILAARDMGYIVSEKRAAQEIKAIMQPMLAQGMTEKEALDQILYGSGLGEQGLLQTVGTDIATSKLADYISSGVMPPQKLVDDAIRFKYESRSAEYFTLDAAKAGEIAAPSAEELAAFYQTVAPQFATPEYRDISVLVLDKTSMGVGGEASDEDLKAHYDSHMDDFTTPESRTIAQVIVKDEDAATAVYETAKAGKDLAAAAKGAKGANYIKSRAYTADSLPAEIADAALDAAEGAVVPPVESALGWHVMHVQKITPETVESFEAAKPRLKKELGAQLVADALYDRVNEVDDMVAGGGGIDDVAREFGLTPVTLEKIDAEGRTKDGTKPAALGKLPESGKILPQAFRLAAGEAGQLIETAGGFLLIGATAVYPPEERPLDDVRGDVLKAWKEKQKAEHLDQLAAKVNERLKLGEPLDKLAKEFGRPVAKTGFLSRDADAGKAGLDQALIPALFSLARVGDAMAITTPDAVIAIRHAAARADTPKDGNSKEDLAAVRAQLARSMQGDILSQYQAWLAKEYGVEINEKLLAGMFTVEEEAY